MLPTLSGRIQTRIFALAVFGGIWTLLITLVLPTGARLGPSYGATFTILLMVIVIGILWELLYHFLMQFRWEKDWPAIFNLGQMIPEGITTFLLLHVAVLNPLGDLEGGDKEQFVPVVAYVMLFVTTWIVTWLFANGPMKIFFIRWRFRGGRLV